MSAQCQICQVVFSNNLAGQLTVHLQTIHSMSLEEYVILTELGGAIPNCICGLCTERPVFYRGKFRRYALGHNSFEKKAELYVAKHGEPRCATCGLVVGFNRGRPKTFCSFTCQGKRNGFSKSSTQECIRKVVQEKYGVENVSQLPKVQQAISESSKGKTVAVSEKTKAKHSLNLKRRWNDPGERANLAVAIKKAVNEPEERKRRSDFAKQQMNNVEHVRLFFGSGFGHLSKLHQRITDCLELNKLGFVSEQPIWPYIADELHLEKRIVIEINGDYIHANPKKYRAEDVIRIPGESYTAQEKWDRDEAKRKYLESKGYLVLVIWESDDINAWKQQVREVVARG